MELTSRFCHVLDGRKSGLKVRTQVKRSDDKKYGRQLDWRDWKKGITEDTGVMVCNRDPRLGRFIVCRINT